MALAPEPIAAFMAFSDSVFAGGELHRTTKDLIAVALAYVTPFAYCIDGQTAAALENGAIEQAIMGPSGLLPRCAPGLPTRIRRRPSKQ